MAYAGTLLVSRPGGNKRFVAPKGLISKKITEELPKDLKELEQRKKQQQIRQELIPNIIKYLAEHPEWSFEKIFNQMEEMGELPEAFNFEMFGNRVKDAEEQIKKGVLRKREEIKKCNEGANVGGDNGER